MLNFKNLVFALILLIIGNVFSSITGMIFIQAVTFSMSVILIIENEVKSKLGLVIIPILFFLMSIWGNVTIGVLLNFINNDLIKLFSLVFITLFIYQIILRLFTKVNSFKTFKLLITCLVSIIIFSLFLLFNKSDISSFKYTSLLYYENINLLAFFFQVAFILQTFFVSSKVRLNQLKRL